MDNDDDDDDDCGDDDVDLNDRDHHFTSFSQE
jgi:hypothetical protein